MSIHSNSDIDPSARIADDVSIGSGCVIGPDAVLESGVEIGANVVIGPYTTLHEGVKVAPGAVIGTNPQDLKFDGSITRCEIGPRTVIREYATINRGTKATGATIIGSDTYIMSYVHVAHDCRIGNHVIMANNASLAGHVKIEDHAVLGGGAVIHQFVRVGTLAMVGGMSGLRHDAPPYMTTSGYPPAKVYGLNSVGLKRAGLNAETRTRLKQAYRLLYRSGYNFRDALDQIKLQIEPCSEILHLIEFFESSRRGVSRGIRECKIAVLDPEMHEEPERTLRLHSGGSEN